MNELAFQHPEAVWSLVIAAVLIATWRALRRRHFAAIAIVPVLAASVRRASPLRLAPMAVALAALLCIVVALMDPVVPYSQERVESRGLDITIVLDLSSSMEEVMGTVSETARRESRLEVTKRAIVDFISRRPHDRIGMVVFSDNAYVVSPLTHDHAYLRRYVALINEQTLRSEGMTAIGEGIFVANALLARQSADQHRNRVIVVFTDGEHNHGRDPVGALADADRAGNRVHLIGVDLADEIKAKPQVLRLIQTVERLGGRYFTADTAGQLTAASRAIDTLETGVLVSRRSVRNAPAFEPFAAAAVLLICGAMLLRSIPAYIDLT
jgi:Ca-activated chloride channel family protein